MLIYVNPIGIGAVEISGCHHCFSTNLLCTQLLHNKSHTATKLLHYKIASVNKFAIQKNCYNDKITTLQNCYGNNIPITTKLLLLQNYYC